MPERGQFAESDPAAKPLGAQTQAETESQQPQPEAQPEAQPQAQLLELRENRTSEWADNRRLVAGDYVKIDPEKRLPYDEMPETQAVIKQVTGMDDSKVIASIAVGSSSNFIVVDTRESKQIASPFLLMQDDNSGCSKGIWSDEITTIGRSKANAADRFPGLADDVGVSLEHFSLWYSADEDILFLQDSASRNGTCVSGYVVEQDTGGDVAFKTDDIASSYTSSFMQVARRAQRYYGYSNGKRTEKGPEAPYGYYQGHPLIGRESVTVKRGVYTSISTERLLVDDDNEIIQKSINDFLDGLEKEVTPEVPSRRVLRLVERAAAYALRYNIEKTDELAASYYNTERLMPLSDFVKAGVGVCRQQAVMAALYAEAAMDKGYLRQAVVSLERNTDYKANDSAGHAWAVYRNADEELIFDPAGAYVGTRKEALEWDRWRYLVKDPPVRPLQ